MEIRLLHRHGKGVREIARETGLSRNTLRRYLRDEKAPRYRPRPPRATKLDPFRGYVAQRLSAAAPERIPATVLLAELRERGYAGGSYRTDERSQAATAGRSDRSAQLRVARWSRLARA